MKIRIAGIIEESIVDGPGIRFVVFTQGCPHNCEGCHNPETHDFQKGELKEINEIVELMRNHPFATGITISGGEPFVQPKEVSRIIKEFKKMYPNKTVMIYTGYVYEDLIKSEDEDVKSILEESDILVDGRYEKSKRDISLHFRGSTNQRLINLKNSSLGNVKILDL